MTGHQIPEIILSLLLHCWNCRCVLLKLYFNTVSEDWTQIRAYSVANKINCCILWSILIFSSAYTWSTTLRERSWWVDIFLFLKIYFSFSLCMSECACECRHLQSPQESVMLPGAGDRGGCDFLRQVLGTKLRSSVITFLYTLSCFVISPVL